MFSKTAGREWKKPSVYGTFYFIPKWWKEEIGDKWFIQFLLIKLFFTFIRFLLFFYTINEVRWNGELCVGCVWTTKKIIFYACFDKNAGTLFFVSVWSSVSEVEKNCGIMWIKITSWPDATNDSSNWGVETELM